MHGTLPFHGSPKAFSGPVHCSDVHWTGFSLLGTTARNSPIGAPHQTYPSGQRQMSPSSAHFFESRSRSGIAPGARFLHRFQKRNNVTFSPVPAILSPLLAQAFSSKVTAAVDESKKQEMQEKTNGARTIPQIFIGDTYVGGYNELKALEIEGKLNSLLEN